MLAVAGLAVVLLGLVRASQVAAGPSAARRLGSCPGLDRAAMGPPPSV